MKKILALLGIGAITYLIARERILLKKTAHDCDRIKLK